MKIVETILVSVGLCAGIGGGLVFAQQAQRPGEKPVTIMPLGDSITEGGSAFHVYRYPFRRSRSSQRKRRGEDGRALVRGAEDRVAAQDALNQVAGVR